MMTCPRCGNPAIYLASEEFKLLDCEFCDDVIDVSDLELPELELEPARTGPDQTAEDMRAPATKSVQSWLAPHQLDQRHGRCGTRSMPAFPPSCPCW